MLTETVWICSVQETIRADGDGGIFSGIGDALNSIGEGASDVLGTVGQGASDLIDTVGSGLSDLGSGIESLFTSEPVPGAVNLGAAPTADLGTSFGPSIDFGGAGADIAGAAEPAIGGASALSTAAPAAFAGGFDPSDIARFADVGNGAAPAAGAVLTGADIPGALDPVAAANFAAQNTGNPAGSALLQGVTQKIAENAPAAAPSLGRQALDFAKANPGALIGAAGLGYQALKGPPAPTGAQRTLEGQGADASQQAKDLAATGKELTQPLVTGRLPPGAQASIDSATKAAEAAIRSRHAAMGTSGSTMEMQDILAARQRAQAAGFQIAQNMAQTGLNAINSSLNAAGLSSNVYSRIMQQELQNDADLSDAVTNFAIAMAGGGLKSGQRTVPLRYG